MTTGPSARPRAGLSTRILLALALAVSLLPLAAPAQADTAPPDTTLPSTVSTDPLPTTQIDGVVWSQVVAGDTVYVGGDFSTARPAGAAAGQQTEPRSNFLAYKLSTGELLSTFQPSFDAQVRALALSPDQKTLYAGGQFTKVNGVNRYRVVAFDLTTGLVKTSFNVTLNSSVYGLAATDSTVYITGIFTSANNVARSGVVAVSAATGAVQPFAVSPSGGTVRQVIVSPDRSKVVLGGAFTSMNGSSTPGYGLAMVDATTGSSLPLPVNSIIRDAGSQSAIMSLVATANGFYGSGYSFTRGMGNHEGAFRADWNGELVWMEDCHGDTYSVAPSDSGVVYVAGHPHYCGNVGAFPQTQPWTFHRGLAFTDAAKTTIGTEPWGYFNFAGRPGAVQLNWYPDINAGSYTGQNQGPWNIATSGNYVLYGGEFTEINGKPQQGLVRFVATSAAPNADGPRLGGDAAGVTVRPYGSAGLRVTWPANYDRDNEHLSYRVYRDDALVYETSADSTFYRRPNLSFLDTNVAAGTSYSYRVRAADPFNNVMWSSTVTGTAGPAGTLSPYQRLVLGDGPQAYWGLDETSGTTLSDLSGSDNASRGSGVTTGVPGAISGDSRTGVRLSGTNSNSTMVNSVPQISTDNFSTEAWFKTTSSSGGQLIGFDSSSTGGSSYADRHIYLTNSGQVYFVARPGNSYKAVNSTGTYRDGKWHHVVATMSGKGSTLYVDGVQVGFANDPKTGMQFNTRTGYWKMAGDTLSGYPSKPSSNNLQADVDEIAVYPVALSADQVKAHYQLGATGVGPNVPPTASFTATPSNLDVAFDASASADTDGSVTDYAWNFGDGLTGTGKTPTHSYAAAGTYPVTLTVTDDRGGTGSVTKNVTVSEAPNSSPTASFTVSSDNLTVSVDGSGSSDSDGTVSNWAWDFGDGSTEAGATASHTYAAAGTYLIKLTVTDNRGGTGSASQGVTVPTGVQPYALDEFDRNVTGGLGSADVGGAWTLQDTKADYSVAGGDALFKLAATGANRRAYLPGATSSSSDVKLSFTTDKPATGGGTYVNVLGRRVTGSDDYRLNLRLTSSNTVTASLGKVVGGVATTFSGTSVTVPGTYAAGTDVNVRFTLSGTGSTTLQAKVWLGSGPEPDNWTVSATDSTAALQTAGGIGFLTYLSGSSTNAPIVVALHRVVATP